MISIQGLLSFGSIAIAALGADLDGHGEAVKPYDYREFSAEQKEQLEWLFRHVICSCPKEKWTKTLAGCPDGCAEPQKAEVRAAVKAGRTNQEVLDDQVRRHGQEVLSLPDSSLPHIIPYAVLGILGVVVVMLLGVAVKPRGSPSGGKRLAPAGGSSPANGAAPGKDAARAASDEDRRLDAAVERDLAEMEE